MFPGWVAGIMTKKSRAYIYAINHPTIVKPSWISPHTAIPPLPGRLDEISTQASISGKALYLILNFLQNLKNRGSDIPVPTTRGQKQNIQRRIYGRNCRTSKLDPGKELRGQALNRIHLVSQLLKWSKNSTNREATSSSRDSTAAP